MWVGVRSGFQPPATHANLRCQFVRAGSLVHDGALRQCPPIRDGHSRHSYGQIQHGQMQRFAWQWRIAWEVAKYQGEVSGGDFGRVGPRHASVMVAELSSQPAYESLCREGP